MALNFPDNPINGEKYVASNSVEYTYDALDDSWTGAVAESTSPANPGPGDISAVPPFEGGDGTQGNPFIITPSIVPVPGGTATSRQRITIINQPGLSIGTWEVQSGPEAKYAQPLALFSSAGTWSGNLGYADIPPTEEGQSYTGILKIGTAYFSWQVIQIANKTVFGPAAVPNASPKTVDYELDNKYGTVTGTYADAPGTLTATGSARFSIDGAADATTGTIALNDNLAVSFDQVAVDSAAEGDLISGSITNDNGFLLTPEMVVDRSPSNFNIGNLENIETDSVATSSNLLLSGFNSRTYVTLATAANTLTDIEASVGGRDFADIPSNQTYLRLIRPLVTSEITNLSVASNNGAFNQAVALPGQTNPFGENLITSSWIAGSAFWNGYFVTAGTYGAGTAYSTDGINWKYGSRADATVSWTSVIAGGGKFLCLGNNGGSAPVSGQYLVQWTTDPSQAGGGWQAVGEANGVGLYKWRSVAYGSSTFVAVSTTEIGADMKGMYSQDGGLNWTQVNLPTGGWSSVTFGDGKFVAVCDYVNPNAGVTGRVIYSADNGVNWTRVDSADDTAEWTNVAYGDGKFVAVAASSGTVSDGVVMTSPDGATWTLGSAPEGGWQHVEFINNQFVASGFSAENQVMYSPDGITWTLSTRIEDGGGNWGSVSYGDGKYVLAGTGNIVYTSNIAGLIESYTLTFDNDQDLEYFTADDAVYQDTGYTPITSDITNTTSTQALGTVTGAISNNVNLEAANNTKYNAFDGIINQSVGGWQIYTNGGSSTYASVPLTTPVTNTTGNIAVWSFNATGSNNGRTLWVNDVSYNFTEVAPNGAPGMSLNVVSDNAFIGQINNIGCGSAGANNLNVFGFDLNCASNSTSDAVPYILSSSVKPVLTFTDTTNFDNLRIGDPLSQADATGGAKPDGTWYYISDIGTGKGYNGVPLYWDSYACDGAQMIMMPTSGYQMGQWIASTTDGTSWSFFTPSGFADQNGGVPSVSVIRYSSELGQWIAMGQGQYPMYYSSNGVNWTNSSFTAGYYSNWYDAVYGLEGEGAKWIACGNQTIGQNMAWSDDGVNWTQVASVDGGADWSRCAYGKIGDQQAGRFIAVASSSVSATSMYSDNGINWFPSYVPVQNPSGTFLNGCTYGTPADRPLGRFVINGNMDGAQGFAWSDDGQSWTIATIPNEAINDQLWCGVVWDGSKYISVSQARYDGQTNQVIYSYDGKTWTVIRGENLGPSFNAGNGPIGVGTGNLAGMIIAGGRVDGTPQTSALYYSLGGLGPVPSGSILEMDSANKKITLEPDNDTLWPVGSQAVGPELTAPTGVFGSADTTAKTMTLSSTNASGTTRWVVDQDKVVIGPSTNIPDPPDPEPGNIYLDPGETMYIRGTTGSGLNTTYYANIKIGNTTSQWAVTTVDGTPQIQEPAIVLPVNGSDELVPPVTLVSSSYVGIDSPGSHASSTWEVYSGRHPITSTNTITNMAAPITPNWTNATGVNGSANNGVAWNWNTNLLMVMSVSGGGTSPTCGISFSTDNGETFTAGPAPTAAFYNIGYCFNTDNAICIPYRPSTATSTSRLLVYTGSTVPANGSVWTDYDFPTLIQNNYHGANYLGGRLQAISLDWEELYYSDNSGQSWSNVITSDAWGGFRIECPGYVAPQPDNGGKPTWIWLNLTSGTQAVYTNDFVTFTPVNLPTEVRASWGYAASNDNCYIVCTGDNPANTTSYLRTVDGIIWTTHTAPAVGTNGILGNAGGGGGLVWKIYGNNNDYYTSIDGIVWNLENNQSPIDIYQLGANGPAGEADRWINFKSNTVVYTPTGSKLWSSSTIAIAGAQSDGFRAGDIIDNCAGAIDTTIESLDDTQVVIIGSGSAKGFNLGDHICRSADNFILVNTSVNDTTNLTTYPIPDSFLDEGKVYSARVQYTSDSNPAILSPFSNYSEFQMKNSYLPEPGDEFGGGYYAGQVNDDGTIYNLIVAPMTSGNLFGQYGGLNANTLLGSNSAALSTWGSGLGSNSTYGWGNTNSQAAGGAPFAQWVFLNSTGPNAGNADPSNTAGTGIGGFNDWYVPATYEMQICFYYLKPSPGATTNPSQFPVPVAVPPMPTTNSPVTQTSSTLFQVGGAQAWSQIEYWCCTPDGDLTFSVNWNGGNPNKSNSSASSNPTRAIRRQPA